MSPLIARQVSIRAAAPNDLPLLEQMYDSFSPAEVALGLPPRDPERRKAWLIGLQSGVNLIALAEDRVVGHLALMPGEHSAEMAVFVHQDSRRHGIGTALADAAVEICRQKSFRSLWVLISSENNAAHRGLLKYGFRTAWESLGEVKMEYAL